MENRLADQSVRQRKELAMLVLSRLVGESIILETSDGKVTITVAEYVGQQTRIGITAPTTVKILREELTFKQAPEAGDGAG